MTSDDRSSPETAGRAHHDHAAHAAHRDGGLAAHDKHAGHSVAMFRNLFWISLALTVPALVWEPMLQEWFGYRAPEFPGSSYIPAVFATLVFLYGGRVFLAGAWRELADRAPGMMTLIGLAITVAFAYSAAVTLGFRGHPLWWELATLVTIMLLGHWIEMRSIFQAKGALTELAKLLPDEAERIVEGDRTERAPIDRLRPGDLVLIRPGASVPADGVVKSGESAVNEALITGESRPVQKTPGDKVIAGSINGQGSLRVAVTGVGEGTALAGIMRLVAEAQSSRSRAQALADRAAQLLTYAAVAAGLVTGAAWSALGAGVDYVVTRVVTVLVIACPHALGLAIPLVVAISTTLAARNGLLVRDRRGLEEARNLDIVVFDKTGTLTLGEHRVVETVAAESIRPDEALRLAAAVERDSEHPIAQALLRSAEACGLDVPKAERFESMPGRGVRAQIGARALLVGGPALLEREGIDAAPMLREAAERFGAAGSAAIWLAEKGVALAVFAVADAIRPESRDAVARLQEAGVEVAMLTGDSQPVADHVARELGIGKVFAQVLPEEKAERIKALQAEGRRVAMVGDGVNDAPALATADVGVAIGAGTDVAVEAGDVVLVRSDPRDVARIIALSRASYGKMLQNLWWAAGYNIFAIPLAAGALAWAGIVLAPAFGAILMSASTVIVALNAQLLRRLRL
ncbi:copper-translocating P-type ATPase [Amphiplicatus metriothermophilus]|uniref:Cu2+-exporting ATPase n=1 Tax=Amphiplicatus metriothermophilus TaxID=1519374 RepID=A0A239PQC9_9PROT|nr:copper-translocating P-type ATPase [Amphiplicatus metriothermophilus]MBB5518588.1 Cu2+-exporting ATPase [Amphiplicatus metriothermophilus]SNT72253.1 Cu2+-exporting ATPase [Amphiplicatus metriothermophilus]